MNWQKRNCPISMKLTPEGHGWENVELVIQGKRHRYYITEAYPDGFWAVVAALYVLYPRRDYSVREGEDDWDGFECLGEYKNGLYIYAPVFTEEYLSSEYTWTPADAYFGGNCNKVTFVWDEEDEHGINWTISRTSNVGLDFDITLELKEWDENNMLDRPVGTFSYTVSYSDFCYAVGKAITDAVKSYGFGGFGWSTHVVNVNQLCFLKACGMGRPWAFERIFDEEHGCGEKTSFNDEMELLNFDM